MTSNFALYEMRLGTLEILGPDASAPRCTIGLWCEVWITGRGLTNVNMVKVVDGLCNEKDAPLAPLTQFINPVQVQQDGSARHYVFAYPSSGIPSYHYSFCWSRYGAEAPAGLPYYEEATIVESGLFTGRIGPFTIAGPFTKNFECTMGVACVFDMPGVGLEAGNAVSIISAGVCGRANSRNENTFVGIPNPIVASASSASDGNLRLELGTPVDGKPTADGYTVCWGFAPVTKWDYSLSVGYLRINGPGRGGVISSESGTIKCYRGRSCTVEFMGIGLLTTNGALVRWPTSSCGDATEDGVVPVAHNGLEINPAESDPKYVGQFRFGGIPQSFRCQYGAAWCQLPICWAHAPDPGQFASYNVFIGILTLLPMPTR